jgi:hypothetical protein
MATDQRINTADVLRIPLTGLCGDRRIVRAWAVVRDDEFGRGLAQYPWHLSSGYASRNLPDINYVRGQVPYMHRLVFERYHGAIPDGLVVDHIDRDRLNNTPENLRAVTQSKNMLNVGKRRNNTSGYTGVGWWRGWWRATVSIDKRSKCLGYFASAREAAVAVNNAYRTHHPHVPPPNDVG